MLSMKILRDIGGRQQVVFHKRQSFQRMQTQKMNAI